MEPCLQLERLPPQAGLELGAASPVLNPLNTQDFAQLGAKFYLKVDPSLELSC